MNCKPYTIITLFLILAASVISCKQANLSTSTIPVTQNTPISNKKDPLESALKKIENSPASKKTNLVSNGSACLTPQESLLWQGSGGANNIFSNILNKGMSDAMSPFLALGGLAASSVDRLSTAFDKKSANRSICGNWCGAHRRLRNESPPAVDELDELCKQHDLCYRQKGAFNCGCDQQLLNSIERKGRRTLSNINMQKILAYYRGSACNGGCKISGGIRMCGRGQVGR